MAQSHVKLAVEDVASNVKRLRVIHFNLFRVVSNCMDSLAFPSHRSSNTALEFIEDFFDRGLFHRKVPLCQFSHGLCASYFVFCVT
jgi:hypothetical protein